MRQASEKNLRIPFRLPIDRVFSVDGFGTVVTGTLIEGALAVGDMAEVLPTGFQARVRNLQVHGRDVESAYAGQRVAVNLAGTKKSDLARGDTIAKPGSVRRSLMLDVRLQNLKNSQRTILTGSQVHLYHGSSVRLSKVVLLDRDALQPGESCYAQLRMTEELAAKCGDRFVVRFYSPLETIGGGVVLDDCPQRHKRGDGRVLESLAIRESGSGDQKLLQTVAEQGWTLPSLEKLAKGLSREAGELAEELEELLRTPSMVCDDLSEKKAVLERYTRRCAHNVSGGTIRVLPMELAENLEGKADWLMEHIRRQEWIADGRDGWFNSYYDNHGQPLEGIAETGARMMLTGQVFAIMSGTATEEQVKAIARSADKYLYKKEEGGYRLNTDFHELKFDMGRMFGFAYGEKENGAVFSHMTVMYANALYRRGFVQEGYKALQTLADAALDFESSKIYPGIPEYFNAEGRGMYHYLTGAASWYMLTVITEAFGVRGENGSLAIAPKLVREQFGEAGTASLALPFAGKRFQVIAVNLSRKDYGEYRLEKAYLTTADGPQMRRLPVAEGRVLLDRALLDRLPVTENQITVELM